MDPDSHTSPARPGTRRDLIRLNTETIRRKALGAYKKEEQALAKLKAQLQHYREYDIPGFRTWIHKTFGQTLTRQRELADAIEEKEGLLSEIQDYADRYRVSELDAYKKVLWRRDHPKEAEEEDQRFEAEHDAQRKKYGIPDDDPWSTDFDGDDSFFGDEDFDNVPNEEWSAFSDFYERMTGQRPPSRGAENQRQATHPDSKNIKQVYRTIVRRLHPDHHGHMSDARKNLWHEAQAAYRHNDIGTLYRILSQCDEGEAGLGNHSPVSLIQNLTRQLKNAARAAKRDIRKTRTDPAWNFEEKIKNSAFVRQIRFELEDVITHHELQLREVDSILAALKKESARQERAPNPSRPGKRKRIDPFNMEFDMPF